MFILITAVVLVSWPFHGSVNSTTAALGLLILVLVISSAFGSRPGYFASILAVLAFNFFFLPPLYTLTIADPQNWVALGAFLVTAVVAGQLSAYARRRAEESEIRRHKIEELYNELRAAFDKASHAEALRQSEQLKSALLDAVTHDLRTPLTSIKASVTTLIEAMRGSGEEKDVILGSEEKAGLLELINDETDRLNDFIGGIVDLARLEAGNSEGRRSWHEIGAVVDAAIERARQRISGHEVTIVLEPELPAVRIDANAVGEIVYLFLDNAAKYSPVGSAIRVTAERAQDESVMISVEDEGAGIPPEERERIFEKFYRSPSESIHSTGSGLGVGLAIVRGIAESQGGEVWVEDGRDGFKTRFVFRFPVGDDEKDVTN